MLQSSNTKTDAHHLLDLNKFGTRLGQRNSTFYKYNIHTYILFQMTLKQTRSFRSKIFKNRLSS